jgi:hypothetical protein
MATDIANLVHDVVASPLGDVIASMGEGVAAAQRALDDASLSQTLAIYSESGDAGLAMLREIGYRPTFYVLPETTGEVNVSLRLANTSAQNGATASPLALQAAAATALRPMPMNRARAYITPVDAGFANQYSYNAQVSAKLSFKIVPVPPPSGTEDLRVLPDLAGATVADARTRLAALGLAPSAAPDGKPLDDTAVVEKTVPAAGAVVRAGDGVALSLKS